VFAEAVLASRVERSIHWTLKELELNLFERKALFDDRYARKLDFGHTFSPFLEIASEHSLLHGEAVAVDMAICAALARHLGVLDEISAARLLGLISRAGLPIHCAGIDPLAMHASLRSVVRHRDGKLNLALPDRIGGAVFIRDLADVSVSLVDEVWRQLGQLSSASDSSSRTSLQMATDFPAARIAGD
jgi:3-dehydroquinate synthetase